MRCGDGLIHGTKRHKDNQSERLNHLYKTKFTNIFDDKLKAPKSYGAVTFFFTRGQFWPSGIVVACVCVCVCVCLSVCQSLVCPRNNSGPVQAKIIKLGPKMQNTLVKIPIFLWTDRPWTSRSNLTWKSKFTPFWACPHHNSPPIQARITKFGPEMQNTLVKIPVVLGAIDLKLQGQIWLKKSNFQVFHNWKYITTI